MGFEHPYYAPIGLSTLDRDKRFGHVLGLCRKSRGLSQAELSDRLGYGVSGQKQVCLWEIGRVTATPATIAAIARALSLPFEDAWYLNGLAGYIPPHAEPTAEELRLGIQLGLAELSKIRFPAHIMDKRWNVRAWNDAAAKVLALTHELHILALIFDPPADVGVVQDWDTMAHHHVTIFRRETAEWRHEDSYIEVIDSLATLPHFREIWERPPAPLDPFTHQVEVKLQHHQLGNLVFNVTGHLAFGVHAPFWLIVFEPVDDFTRQVFA